MKLFTTIRSLACVTLALFSLSTSAAVVTLERSSSLLTPAETTTVTQADASSFVPEANFKMDGKMWFLLLLAVGLYCTNKIISANPEHRDLYLRDHNGNDEN